MDAKRGASSDQAAELLQACVNRFAIDHHLDGRLVEPMIGGANLRAQIGLTLDLRIRDETLRSNRHALLDDRVLDLGRKSDARTVADLGWTADDCEVPDQAVTADLERALEVGAVTNLRACADDDRAAQGIQNDPITNDGGRVDDQ